MNSKTVGDTLRCKPCKNVPSVESYKWTGEFICHCCGRNMADFNFTKKQRNKDTPRCVYCTGRKHTPENCRFSSTNLDCCGYICRELCKKGLYPNVATKGYIYCHLDRIHFGKKDGRSYCFNCSELTVSCAKSGDEDCNNDCGKCCYLQRVEWKT